MSDGYKFFLSLTSFFHILALTRTLSNSVETSLTAAALCFWPWHSLNAHRYACIINCCLSFDQIIIILQTLACICARSRELLIAAYKHYHLVLLVRGAVLAYPLKYEIRQEPIRYCVDDSVRRSLFLLPVTESERYRRTACYLLDSYFASTASTSGRQHSRR